jgi:CheY-like chemotaxis protein
VASILIVEDEADSREALEIFLRRKGHRVESASNGTEAIAALVGRAPDAIVLDMSMPEVDGTSVLRAARSYLRLQSLPVVVMTAFPEGRLAATARDMGVCAILAKGTASLDDVHRAIEESLPYPALPHPAS